MWENMLVYLILAFTLFWAVRSLYRLLTGKDAGTCGFCSSCPSAEACGKKEPKPEEEPKP